MTRRGPWLCAALALLAALLGGTPGLTWDEPVYCYAGATHLRWLSGDLPLKEAWAPNHEHPPLAKLAYGAAIALGGHRSYQAPARAAAALMFAGLAFLTAWVGARLFGAMAGMLAGLALILMPQVLAHAHLAALDLPMALAWMGAAAFSLRGGQGWKHAILLGVLWGLALLTKVNGAFLIAPLLAWGLITRSLSWRQVPLVIGVGLLVFWAGWPWLWQDTFSHLQAFLLKQTDRWVVPSLYLGQVYDKAYPPWHYPLVMTAVTMPPALLAAAFFGGGIVVKKRPEGRGWLLLHLAFTLGLACLPGVPRYDGVRLFLTAFPFLALLAGLGLDLLFRAIPSRRWAFCLGFLLLAPTVFRIAALDPCLLSYYSPLVGGLKGAERLGFETSFWGDAFTPELLGQIKDPGRVAIAPMGEDYFVFLGLEGALPGGSTWDPRPESADVLLMLGRRGMLKPPLRRLFEDDRIPWAAETRREGVVLAKLYRRR